MGCNRFFLLLASLALAAAPVHAAGPKPLKLAETAAALPPITYQDEKGQPQTADFSKAKLTVLHFWATWCAPCLKELPELEAAYAAYQGRGLQILSLSLDGNAANIAPFFRQAGITHLPAYTDAENTALRAVQGSALPLTLLVNAQGQEIARANGPVEWSAQETRKTLNEFLTSPSPRGGEGRGGGASN